VKWREYPDEAARKQDQGANGPRNGTMREGPKWGPGPELRTVWAVIPGPPHAMALVHEAPHGRSWSLAQDNQPLQERAR
jgi:hypothetical protein